MAGNKTGHESDRALVQKILAGDEKAWHVFIDRFSGLIYAILRRYLFDEEEIRNVWVQTLERLYRGRLRSYQAKSSLSTWLVFVTRSVVFDHLRHLRGRRTDPPGIDSLDSREKMVYERLFQQGRSTTEVHHELQQKGLLNDGKSLAEIVAVIEEALGQKVLRRIAWDLQAASVGEISGRVLEFLETAARECRDREDQLNPEVQWQAQQARETLTRIGALLDRLPEEQKRVLQLRFDQGWPAGRVAEELGLASRREVYSLSDKAILMLRKLLGVACFVVRIVGG